jgi:hypothetical protein
MTLREFLESRAKDPGYAHSVRRKVERWREAEGSLIRRLESLLALYPQLELEERDVRLVEQSIPYSVGALTIRFGDAEILVEPKGLFLEESRGRVAMSCGARLVLLDWTEDTDAWTFRWSSPPEGKGSHPVTDEAIEKLIEELLA